ncbi:MAG: glycolate oxidase subunit GlcE [Pseudomonadota bacterium]
MTELQPQDETSAAEMVRAAAAERTPLEIVAGGSRRGLGRPVQAARTLSALGLTGVTLYEPGALTLVARAGTPLREVEAALAAEGQRLAFEPPDHRPLLGSEGAEPTLGGVVATAASGPRRIQVGACRDFLLGARFVNGAGELVKAGGRVMKNVTGYDLARLMAGAYGTLGLLTELSFKVLPTPETATTLALRGLDDATAVRALSAALGSPYDVTGAAHLPAGIADPAAMTLIRLEGFADSVAARAGKLSADLAGFGAVERIDDAAAVAERWASIRDARPFAGRPGAVWRVSVKPSDGPKAAAALPGAQAFYDWGGGLVWLLLPEAPESADPAQAQAVRAAAAAVGGRATLVRASEPLRAALPVFPEDDPVRARLSAELKRRFDPAGVFNPGRMRPV